MLKKSGRLENRDASGLMNRFNKMSRSIGKVLKCMRESQCISVQNKKDAYMAAMEIY